MNPFLALDPGETTGWCLFDDSEPAAMGTCNRTEFGELLEDIPVDFYIVEDFLLFPGKARALILNRMVPARVIGEIEHVARKNNAHIYFQKSEILKLAYARFGYKDTSKHQLDALMHGLWYLHKDDKPDATVGHPKPSEITEPRVRPPTRIAEITEYSGLAKAWRQAGIRMSKKGM